MTPVVVSYVDADANWASWLAWELSRRGVPVSLERADLAGWDAGTDTVDRRDGFRYVPLLSPSYASAVPDSAWWWAPELLVPDDAPPGSAISPIVVGPGAGEMGTVPDLSTIAGGDTAAAVVLAYLDVQSPVEVTSTPLFGDAVPRYPGSLPDLWRMWPAPAATGSDRTALVDALRAIFMTRPDRSMVVSVTARPGSGVTAAVTEFAAASASTYTGCWTVECSQAPLLQAEVDRVLQTTPHSDGVGDRGLLALTGADRVEGTVVLPAGVWHVLLVSADPHQPPSLGVTVGSDDPPRHDLGDRSTAVSDPPSPVLSAPAAMLAALLGACDHRNLPLWVLRWGAPGAPDELADRLADPNRLAALLAELAEARLVHLSPYSVRLRSAGRESTQRQGPVPEQLRTAAPGFVTTMTAVAISRCPLPGGLDHELITALQHLTTALAGSPPPRRSHSDLREYLDQWADGTPQAATVLSALSTAAFRLSRTSTHHARYLVELIARARVWAGDEISVQTRITASLAHAHTLRLAGDPQAAITHLDTCDALARDSDLPAHLDDRPSMLPGALFVERAQALGEAGEPARGADALRELNQLVFAGGASAPGDMSPIWTLHADLLSRCERFDEAIGLLEGARVLDGPGTDAARALDVYAFCLAALGRFADAVAACERALAIQVDRPVGDRVVRRPAVTRVDALTRAGRFGAALDAAEDGRRFLEGTGEPVYLVHLMRCEAEVHRERGAVDQCVERFRSAAILARAADLDDLAYDCRYEAGRVLLDAGRVGDAVAILGSTTELSNAADRDDAPESTLKVGADVAILRARIDLERRRPDSALAYARAATRWVDRLGVIDARFIEAYHVCAQTLLELGLTADVVVVIEHARAVVDRSGHTDDLDPALRLVLGRAQRSRGDTTDALDTLAATPTQTSALASPMVPALILLERGMTHLDTGSRERGLGAVLDSLRTAADADHSDTPAQLLAFQRRVVELLLGVGEAEFVRPLAEELPAAARRVHGERSLQMAECLDHLSRVRVAVGDAETAVELSTGAVALCRDLGEHPAVLAVRLYNLGHALLATGRPLAASGAIKALREATSHDVAVYGDVHEQVLIDLQLLAVAQHRAGMHAASQDTWQHAQEVQRRLDSPPSE